MSIQTDVCKSLKKLSGYRSMYYLYSSKRALFQNISQGKRLLQCFLRNRESVEWSLPKWLLPVKASSRKHQLTRVHFTRAKLFCLLQFGFLELIAQGYDGEDTKGHFSQEPQRKGDFARWMERNKAKPWWTYCASGNFIKLTLQKSL